ncbi:MAG: pyruvate ferredoxin oxidoreductase subunit gamma [Promethearchaeota archaeon]
MENATETEKNANSSATATVPTVEVVVFGRGGQGAVTAAQIIAEAAFLSGNFSDVLSFPSFGAERRGAPVQAYARLATRGKIYSRSLVYAPDVVVVLDETALQKGVLGNVKDGGIVVVNTTKTPEQFAADHGLTGKRLRVVVTDVNRICVENELYVKDLPVLNTPILGALAGALDEIGLETMQAAIEAHLGPRKGKKNADAAGVACSTATCVEVGGNE